jgi:uncharacterized membrane protein YfcA
MRLFPSLVMLCAAFAAGAINAIAGGGTLLTFPVLIWLGLDPKVANGTSTVGGALGGLLLVRTPNKVFAELVPFLILFATLLFMSNGVVNRHLHVGSIDEKPMGLWWTGAMIFQFFSAMYGGYFGAGNGILMLAAMGVLGLNELHRANGIKNFLGICINAVAVLIFTIAGYVVWEDALLMACAALIGGYFGAKMAMRVGQKWVRRGIVLIGWVIFFVMIWKLRQQPQ